jgi:hypothetical protein
MTTTEQRTGFRLPWAPEPTIKPVERAVDDHPQADPEIRPEAHAETEGPQAVEHHSGEDPFIDPTSAEAPVTDEPALATIDPRLAPWPSADEGHSSVVGDQHAPETEAVRSTPFEPAPRRRENLLVTGLVRAMRDAALAARGETSARYADEAKARVETIQAEAADEAARIRRAADEAIAGIRDWSKAEMARIKEETEQRITDRRRHLESEVEEHEARTEHKIKRVEEAVASFGATMDVFFERLLIEEDPSRLAGLAEQLPEPPTLESVDDETWVPFTLDADDAAAAETEAMSGLTDLGDESELTDPYETTGPQDDVADSEVVERLARFTGPPAGGETAEAVTRLSVTGLVSVAAIAGFKRTLGKQPGVNAVAVASGPTGDFVFTVRHAGTTDLRTVVAALEGFEATITSETDDLLSVTASDPDSNH